MCFYVASIAETTGRAVVGGAALFGVGALCYYGLGLFNEVGAIDRAMVWPQVVRDRVRSTYSYFAGSLALTAGTAYAISQSRAIYTLMRASPWVVSSIILNISLIKIELFMIGIQVPSTFIHISNHHSKPLLHEIFFRLPVCESSCLNWVPTKTIIL